MGRFQSLGIALERVDLRIDYLVTSLERGGAEFSIPSVVDVLRGLGHDVHVYVCEPRDRVAEPRLKRAGITYTVLFDGEASKWGSIRRYAVAAVKSRPDLIWTSLSHATFVGQIAGALLRVPVVSWKHSAEAKRYIRRHQKRSRVWIADSHDVAEYLQGSMGVPEKRIATWPLFAAAVDDVPMAAWNGVGPLKIGSSGRLNPQKNYDLLIRAIGRLRELDPGVFSRIELSIAGEGPMHAELLDLIVSLQLQEKVKLLGWVQDIEAYLSGLHLYIQPSAFEGMCIAAHEAMAMGLPVVASPVGELRRSIQPGVTGLLLGSDIVESAATSIQQLFHSPAQLKTLGAAAKRYVNQTMRPEAFAAAGAEVMRRVEAAIGASSGSGRSASAVP